MCMLKHRQATKTPIALALVAALGGTILQAGPVEAATQTPEIETTAASQHITFDAKLHGPVTQTDAVAIEIPELCHDGGLSVKVTVSDEYDGRENRSAQPDESVVVEMWRGSELVADVGPTPDLPDGIRSALVHTDLGTIPVPVKGDVLIVRMSDPGTSYSNSVVINDVELTPICKPPVETRTIERVVEVEKVVVAEKVVTGTFTTCEAGILGVVARMYESYFDRRPDAAGLLFWSGQLHDGMRLQELSGLFEDSPEFVSLTGTLTDEEFVQTIYRNALHRSAEPGGLAFWLSQLAEGKSRAWVVTAIAVQPESLQAGCFAR